MAGEVVALIAVAPHFKSAGRKSAIQNRQASVCGVVLSVSPRESHGTTRLFSIEPEISSLPTLVRFTGRADCDSTWALSRRRHVFS